MIFPYPLPYITGTLEILFAYYASIGINTSSCASINNGVCLLRAYYDVNACRRSLADKQFALCIQFYQHRGRKCAPPACSSAVIDADINDTHAPDGRTDSAIRCHRQHETRKAKSAFGRRDNENTTMYAPRGGRTQGQRDNQFTDLSGPSGMARTESAESTQLRFFVDVDACCSRMPRDHVHAETLRADVRPN